MPTYQYVCTECGDQVEAVQKFTDDPLTVHDACGGRLRKVFSPEEPEELPEEEEPEEEEEEEEDEADDDDFSPAFLSPSPDFLSPAEPGESLDDEDDAGVEAEDPLRLSVR